MFVLLYAFYLTEKKHHDLLFMNNEIKCEIMAII